MDYPAKIILFGEYGVLLNSKALAIPFPRFSGRFRLCDASKKMRSQKEGESHIALSDLYNYFKSRENDFKFLNIKQFENDLQKGLYFDSSIPSGSGLGSSGALTAAVYDRYVISTPAAELLTVKSDLAAIESFFHGTSSGIDPFICWLQKPVLFENNRSIKTMVDLSPFLENYSLFLINSHSCQDTGTLVNHFMQSYQLTDFKAVIDQEYIPIINQTIDAALAADFSTFETLMARYSQIQLTHFKPMIPERMINFFRYGIENREFYLKICGSGGGGFILGISHDRHKAETYFNLNHLDYTIV